MYLCTSIHKSYKPRFFFFPKDKPQFLTKIPAFGRANFPGPNGCSMAASIAHTMMGLGLGKNGCVLWIKGKKSSQFFGSH